ncbi:MAG: hypothetical protein KF898_02025 [Parachlamydiales bacterium]|nr:hypothetical protein [Candidatus Acheromyda pituitae]
MPNSFDLFDTLLGRLHCHPDSIFYQVQNRFPFPGFVFYRMMAEAQSDKTLADIYRHFQKLTGISKKEALALMEFEFQTELTQIYPIMENLRLVEEGDLIVSDTYYNADQIKQILNKIGLGKKVHIYATPRGKSAGTIWEKIKAEHSIAKHMGDSLRSDVDSPKAKNIDAVHYANSQLSCYEQQMASFGQEALAFLMRALRLQNPYPHESPEYLLWNDQCQINIPLLLQASLYLDAFSKKKKKKRILFTTRDGCLWIQLFQKLFPDYESIVFHSSRYAYTFPSSSYIDYVKELYTDDTLIVDSHGSGISCTQFFKKHLNKRPVYLSIVNNKKTQNAILRVDGRHETVEKLNYDLIGTLYDMNEKEPLRCEIEYDTKFVEPSHLCVKKCAAILDEYALQPFDQRVVQWASDLAWSGLAIDRFIDHAPYHVHLKEEAKTRHLHILCSGHQMETSPENV